MQDSDHLTSAPSGDLPPALTNTARNVKDAADPGVRPLLPCPFCGEDPMDIACETGFGTAYIHCPNRDMHGPEVVGVVSAIQAWNVRHTASDVA